MWEHELELDVTLDPARGQRRVRDWDGPERGVDGAAPHIRRGR